MGVISYCNTHQFFRLSLASSCAPTSKVMPRLLGGVLFMLLSSTYMQGSQGDCYPGNRAPVNTDVREGTNWTLSITWISSIQLCM